MRSFAKNKAATFVIRNFFFYHVSVFLGNFAKHEAVILKLSANVIITSREMIISRYDAIPDQSERTHFYNHRSNFI